MNLTTKETATILAALRMFQDSPDILEKYMVYFSEEEPMDDTDVDDLIERINLDKPPIVFINGGIASRDEADLTPITIRDYDVNEEMDTKKDAEGKDYWEYMV